MVKDHHVEYIEVKYSLNIIGDIISLIGFMIYLEIIELNFCDFNYNIRKSIAKRGLNELQFLEDNSEDFDNND